jgi:DNA helicase-2/ATP-dependent DNA helicase PcrA
LGNPKANVGGVCWNGLVDKYTPGQLARLLRLPEPTAEQAAVIAAPLGPLAVIAGAGSGKSETMAARLVWLVANGMVRPDRVLGLTFTRKAAAELAERVRVRLDALRRARLADSPADDEAGPWAGEPVISTYHSYAGRLVSDHALREGLEPSMRLITAALSWQLASSIVATYDGPMDEVQWTPQTVTAAVLDLAGDLAEHLKSSGDVRGVGQWLDAEAARWPGRVLAGVRKVIESQRTREQLLPLVDRYAEAKRVREVLDHGDQVRLAAQIAMRHPEVGAAERTRYQVVLLDEYQDTSHAQLKLLNALYGNGHPVTAVGDPCQSIYGWRGASAGNLRRFARDFPARSGDPAPVQKLSTSFRNAGRVLDAAAVLQAELRAQAPDVPLLEPAPDRGGRGEVRAALLETVTEESEWVAAQAAALLALPVGSAPDGRPWPDGRPAGVRPSDIAVLCRKRSQFVPLRRALDARGIPCEVVGLGGLLSVPEVQDVAATLRVLHDASSSDALARLLTGPRWRIGPRDLVALGRRARDLARGVADAARGAGASGGSDRPEGPGDPDGASAPDGTAVPVALDPLAEAVTDLTTADSAASLVEALDDLGDPAEYSQTGYARLSVLAAETRRLREHVTRPLADLIAEVERALSLDIEVAARPGGDLAAARADLDAFTDVAATFAGDQPEPTLGAFLAFLSAAQQEEFGLETGRVGETDTVKLLTVHAAKGLQWPAVFIPGLAAGEKSQVFPARPRAPTKWTRNPRLIPFPLRGDREDLPELRALDADSLAEFNEACAGRDLAEERRLAYVAATRAAFWLGCSGYWWGDATSPLGPSAFLAEVRAACEAGAGTVARWAGQPADGTDNPLLAEVDEADWPVSPAGRHYAAVTEAAAMVADARRATEAERAQAAAAGLTGDAQALTDARDLSDADGLSDAQPALSDAQPALSDAQPALSDAQPALSDAEPALSDAERELVAAWQLDTGLLLAERDARSARGDGPVDVVLPARLSVSALVALARDPDELARQVRRPMPQPPARQARRGTAFHVWLEERFGQQRLIDDEELFLDDAVAELDDNLIDLKARFEAGEWGGRWPREVEVPFDTQIGDRQIRGRIDAVFADPDGGYDVVDWKTGQLPRTRPERDAVAVQLAAYRLAWSALAGVPLDQVRAAFYYVRHDHTVRPADLLDADGLRDLITRVPVAG